MFILRLVLVLRVLFGSLVLAQRPSVNINELTPTDIKYELPQRPYQQKVYYGLKWGLGTVFPTEQYGIIQTQSANYTSQMGGLINFRVSEQISIRHELGITTELVRASKSASRPLGIEVPWLVNFHFNEQTFLFAGFYPTVLASRLGNNVEKSTSLVKSDLDLASAFGLGYIWEDDWHVSLRFIQSFNQVVRIPNQEYISVQVSLSYLFFKLSDEDRKLMRVRMKRLRKSTLETKR